MKRGEPTVPRLQAQLAASRAEADYWRRRAEYLEESRDRWRHQAKGLKWGLTNRGVMP